MPPNTAASALQVRARACLAIPPPCQMHGAVHRFSTTDAHPPREVPFPFPLTLQHTRSSSLLITFQSICLAVLADMGACLFCLCTTFI